jgi:hypothetical protein
MKDPSGGTTGRVKPYGRLGWMGARAEYSYGEGLPLPHEIGRRRPAARSKRPAIFLTCWVRIPKREPIARRAGRRRGSPIYRRLADQGSEWPAIPSVRKHFRRSRSIPCLCPWTPPTRRPATGDGTSAVALTAAKASTSPAPKRSSRPGEPRSRAVPVRIARSSRGVSVRLRSGITAASALMPR